MRKWGKQINPVVPDKEMEGFPLTEKANQQRGNLLAFIVHGAGQPGSSKCGYTLEIPEPLGSELRCGSRVSQRPAGRHEEE